MLNPSSVDGDGPSSAEGSLRGVAFKPKDIIGLKYFDRKLLPLFERLHDDDCARDKAGGETACLHYDQYCLMVLGVSVQLGSVRRYWALPQASELKNVQKRLGCQRAAARSLRGRDDFRSPTVDRDHPGTRAADWQNSRPGQKDERLAELPGTLTLVDATLITAMPRIMQASVRKRQGESGTVKWRLHTLPGRSPCPLAH